LSSGLQAIREEDYIVQIKDIMSKNVEIVAPETPLKDVAIKMQQRDCGCIVVAKDDRLVGIITDRDIALRCVAAGHHPVDTTAEQVMSPQILYCRDTDTADAVTKNMGENKVRRLAVLDTNKRLVGVVTLGDISKHTNFELIGKTLGEICVRAA
jgi:CBS domain-containing protein